jgi:hypothetical protein
MRSTVALGCLLTVLLCALSSWADDKKDEKKDGKKDDKDAKEKLVSLGSVVGKLSQVEGAQKYITVQITIPVVVPTAGGTTTVNRGGRLYVVPTGGGYQIQNITKAVELEATDDIKVRTLILAQEFDEKGRPRKYSSKELLEMRKPDPNLPGYHADFDSLKPGQTVKISIARKAGAKPAANPTKPAAEKKKKGKDDDDAEEKDAPSSQKPFVTMVIILDEPVK